MTAEASPSEGPSTAIFAQIRDMPAQVDLPAGADIQRPARIEASRIRFEADARTNWHLHSTGQLLLVEEGRGRLDEMGGGKAIDVKAGEPV